MPGMSAWIVEIWRPKRGICSISWFSITWLSIESVRFTTGVTSFTSTEVVVVPALRVGSTVNF